MTRLRVVFIAICLVYVWFVTYGTGRLLGTEVRGASYDSLSRSLLKGQADIDPDTMGFEAIRANGKAYMYYGVFPAVLRIPATVLTPSLYGQWSRVSCLLAAIAGLLAFTLMTGGALRRNTALNDRQRSFVELVLLVGFGLGSPMLFLISCAHVYHEPVIWGFAWSLWAVYFAARVADDPAAPRRALAGLSFSAGAALCSRITVGMPLYPVAAAVGLKRLISVKAGRVRDLAALAWPGTIALAIEIWYQWSRHEPGHPLTYTTNYIKPETMGGVFNPGRIPSALYNYFGWRPGYLQERPPFIRMQLSSYFDDKLFYYWKEPTLPLSIASPWLLLIAFAGLCWLVIRREQWMMILVALIFLGQCAIISMYYFNTQRYVIEYIPFLTVGCWYWCRRVGRSGEAAITRWQWALAMLVAFSVWTTVGSTIDWTIDYNASAPIEFRNRLAHFFRGT